MDDEWFEERAAILQYDAGLTRAEAEKLARQMSEQMKKVFGDELRQPGA